MLDGGPGFGERLDRFEQGRLRPGREVLVTAHHLDGAEGSTVDTAHVIVRSNSMTGEALYVAMSRGRHSNIVYIATDDAGAALPRRPSNGPGPSACA